MKLSISNIAWQKEIDDEMYNYISNLGFQGIEIAPTRIFKNNPYDNLEEAKLFSEHLMNRHNLKISSMQSIWYGRNEKLFGINEERESLLKYTKKAIDFASVIECNNLVLGSPKNRIINNEEERQIAVKFFLELGEYAYSNGVVLSIEPNPTLYGTNFINTTEDALALTDEVSSLGFKVNLDLGTIIYNNEKLLLNNKNISQINHIHISEPNLALIKQRDIHKQLSNLLVELNYNKYVSIEMANRENIEEIKSTLKYVMEVF